MRQIKLGIIATAIATTAFVGQGASYAASRYEVQSGTVSIYFYPFTLPIFKSAGLNLVGSENTVTLSPDFEASFNILPPSDNNSSRGSNFTFHYDFNTRRFTPITGTIETAGNFVFNNSATNLPLSAIKKLGNFTVGIDNNSSSLFVKDNLDAQVQIGKLNFFRFSSVVDNELFIDSDLVFGKEISDLLKSEGAINTSGYRGGRVLIAASVVQVPEPRLILGIIGVSLSCIASHRSKKNSVVASAQNKLGFSKTVRV